MAQSARHDRDTRQEIADAALALFLQQGYEGASMRDLADRVGVTSAAFYYHYRS